VSHNTRPRSTQRKIANEYLTIRHVQERSDLEQVFPIGEIDLCTAPMLREVLTDTDRRQVPNVLVDLSKVGFLALIGVQALQSAGERACATDRRLVLVAPTPSVQRVLSLADVAGELEIYVSMRSAMSALTPTPI
jgi:anti-anti-sigma factor